MITIAFFKWILYGDYNSFKEEVEYFKKGILFLLGYKYWRQKMKQYKKEFEKWFDEYFCDQQGEDSPYSYQDVLEAFKAGVKSGDKEWQQTKTYLKKDTGRMEALQNIIGW